MSASSSCSVRCTAPTRHIDLSRTVCAELTTSRIAALVEQARGSKAAFFSGVQNATAPLEITGEGWEGRLSQRLVRGNARYTVPVARAPHVAFIGDSITGEMVRTYMEMVPTARVTFFHVNTIDDGVADDADYVISRTLMHSYPAPTDNPEGWAQNDTALWHHLASSRWDAVFVGGMGLHELYHKPDSFSKFWATKAGLLDKHPLHGHVYSAYQSRRALVRRRARQFACLSRQLAAPFVFVGSPPVDGDVVLLDPPKPDWHEFLDFGLARVVARVEREVEASHCVRGEMKGVHRREATPRTAQEDSLLFFHLSDLARACPGARCDGLHFDSAFGNYGCYGSLVLLAAFMEDFLRTYLPHLLGLPCAAPETVKTRADTASSQPLSSSLASMPRTCFPWVQNLKIQ
jgi:hypothetical protein